MNAAQRTSGCRPSHLTWAVSPPVGSYRLQPPSPFIIITQPESRYSFTVPRRVEGWVDLGTAGRVLTARRSWSSGSMSDCGARGPGIESRCGQLCLSHNHCDLQLSVPVGAYLRRSAGNVADTSCWHNIDTHSIRVMTRKCAVSYYTKLYNCRKFNSGLLDLIGRSASVGEEGLASSFLSLHDIESNREITEWLVNKSATAEKQLMSQIEYGEANWCIPINKFSIVLQRIRSMIAECRTVTF